MKKRLNSLSSAWPVIVAPVGAVSWVKFIKLIAPNLTQNETVWAVVLGGVAVVSVCLVVIHTYWVMKLYGHLRVSAFVKSKSE